MDIETIIMIVEDDEILANEIRSFLLRWGYCAKICTDFQNITGAFLNWNPHLVLMDINLPYYDGFYWCRMIREISAVPVIYISSRSDDRDKVMAIAQGGDDYVEKPFHLELLKAKIEAILRRTYQYRMKEEHHLSSELLFDAGTSSLRFHGATMELTKSEKRILSVLLDHRPDIVSRDELMMELWNTDEYVSDGTLTTMISRLRSKIRAFCDQDIILTKKGQGYFIK